jgi:beta-mannosidase
MTLRSATLAACLLCYVSALAQSIAGFQISQNWSFRQADDSAWLPAAVPGTVHTDLLQNGIIEDPFYRDNERRLQWIDKADWEYAVSFEVGAEILQKERIALIFKGLDTYADVYLNDSLILRADNFYRSWEAEVKPLLLPGANRLRVYFHSPMKIGLQKLQAHGYPLPASNDQSENGEMGENRVSIFTRKPGYHYGWDWGPRLVSSGIWQPIELLAWDDVRIHDLYFDQISLTRDKAVIIARLDVESPRALEADFLVEGDGRRKLAARPVSLQEGRQTLELEFSIPNPKLWWTRELGKPNLYQLSGILSIGGAKAASLTRNVGLRSLRLVQEATPKGSSFYFELNGVPVFAKGANYIPNDVFIPRVTDDQYRNVINSAVAANMNMLRVWGGGFYEKDIFYELCDQNGILVWQDFMFACAIYPGDEAFLENVRQEAAEQARRLRKHPSVALWCGNNEIDQAWAHYIEERGWGWKQLYSPEQRAEIWASYEKIFHEILPETVKKYAPQTFYWPSSPYAGPGQHALGSGTSGNTHYWGVWHGEAPFSEYRNNLSPFVSEYGFQSFPEFNTVKKYTLPEDWDIESDIMAAHQRSGIGNLRIRSYMEQHYRVPERFEDVLYVGQLLQAGAIREAIEAHRIAKPFCMGSLYWQINDCWPVASWSGMDYYQNWKALHYTVKKAFEPVLLAARHEGDWVKIYAVSDRLEPIAAALRWQWISFDGPIMAESEPRLAEIPANASALLDSIRVDWLLTLGKPEACVLRVELEGFGATLLYLAQPKDLTLPADPMLMTVEYEEIGGQNHLSLYAEKLVKNVYLQWEDAEGSFSDNYFDMLPGEEKWISFVPRPGSKKPLRHKFSATSLVDIYGK